MARELRVFHPLAVDVCCRFPAMSIYGHSKRQVDDYGLQEMADISLEMPAGDLRRIAEFLTHCADEAESGNWQTSHRHLDSFDPDWRRRHPELDVVVLLPSSDPPRTTN